MNERRFRPGMTATVSGVTFRVETGVKAPGDLVLKWTTPNGPQAISMAAVFLMVDMWIENEDHLRQFRPHWNRTAAQELNTYFQVVMAEGWEAAAKKLENERQQARQRKPDPRPEWCGEQAPNGAEVCTLPQGHIEEGHWHRGPSLSWAPRRAA